MAYIDYKAKEDLQDDTFMQIATLNWSAMLALGSKDTEALVGSMSILFLTCWRKMDKYIPKDFEERLKDLEKSLYGEEELSGTERSKLFDKARGLYKDLAGGLSDAGLLFRATVDASNIGAREEL